MSRTCVKAQNQRKSQLQQGLSQRKAGYATPRAIATSVHSQETDGEVEDEDKEKQVSHRADLSLFPKKSICLLSFLINLSDWTFYKDKIHNSEYGEEVDETRDKCSVLKDYLCHRYGVYHFV